MPEDPIAPTGKAARARRTFPANDPYLFKQFFDHCPEDALNWVEVERQHLGALFEQMADLYSAQLCDNKEYYRATSVCHEILTRDQRMEAIHRRLMFCYGKLGMCNKVEQQYRLLSQIMEREFQSKPSAETTRLYQQIKKECE